MRLAFAGVRACSPFKERRLKAAEQGAAAVVVVVGKEAHQQLAPMLDLPDPVYVVPRQLGGTERLVVYLPHPNAFTAKTFHGVLPGRGCRTPARSLPLIRSGCKG